jgi:hypothetical protein
VSGTVLVNGKAVKANGKWRRATDGQLATQMRASGNLRPATDTKLTKNAVSGPNENNYKLNILDLRTDYWGRNLVRHGWKPPGPNS